MKTVVIYHRADFDGIFCKQIAKKFLGTEGVVYIGWDHGDEKIAWPEGAERVYILDLSPDCLVPDWAASVDRVIWIDHHATAIAKWPEGIPGYRIDGVAACRLAWQWFAHEAYVEEARQNGLEALLPGKEEYVERRVKEPVAVRWAGEYDVWDKRDPMAGVFQHGLRSWEWTDYAWEEFLDLEPTEARYVESALHAGELVQAAQQTLDAQVVTERSFRARFEGMQFLCLNTARCNSLTFKAEEKLEDEGLMGFFWNGKKWKVSLYGAAFHPSVDLSAIAVRYRGGGHKQACGFEFEGNFLELLKPI